MLLSDYLSRVRLEVQDTAYEIWTDDELTRGLEKSISLMSRLMPKRSIIETSITTKVSNEILTISSGTGTLAKKPVKVNSLSIPNKSAGTHYTINHLTGVVTGVGSGLADGEYTVSYELDSNMLDLSTFLPETDRINIERVEYPAGDNTKVVFELYGNLLLLKGSGVTLTDNSYLRIIYLKPWTPPTLTSDGDYPEHLDNAVIIGSAGQALIFKAEKYVQEAVSVITALTAPTAPSLPNKPTAPAAPDLNFTEAEYALSRVATGGTEVGVLKDAKNDLISGRSYINAATRGADVGVTYGNYANVGGNLARAYTDQAQAYLRREEHKLAKYASEVTSYGSSVNAYANEISGLLGKYREESGFYQAQVQEQETKAARYLDIAGRYLASGQSKIQEFLIMLGVKTEFFSYKGATEQFS